MNHCFRIILVWALIFPLDFIGTARAQSVELPLHLYDHEQTYGHLSQLIDTGRANIVVTFDGEPKICNNCFRVTTTQSSDTSAHIGISSKFFDEILMIASHKQFMNSVGRAGENIIEITDADAAAEYFGLSKQIIEDNSFTIELISATSIIQSALIFDVDQFYEHCGAPFYVNIETHPVNDWGQDLTNRFIIDAIVGCTIGAGQRRALARVEWDEKLK